MFLTSDEFDIAMVKLVRNTTRKFLELNKESSMNGLPIEFCAIVEENPKARTLEEYIENILMKDNEDA